MKAISERQSRLLAQAIASPLGAVPLGERGVIAGAGNSFAALVRHGLMVVAEDEEGVRRLVITSAGRAAMSIEPTPDRVRRKVKRASRTHDAIAGLEPSEPSEEESEIAAQVGPRGRIGVMLRLTSRPEGATVPEIMAATGWLSHSIRAAVASSLRARLGYKVEHLKGPDGGRYRTIIRPQAEESHAIMPAGSASQGPLRAINPQVEVHSRRREGLRRQAAKLRRGP